MRATDGSPAIAEREGPTPMHVFAAEALGLDGEGWEVESCELDAACEELHVSLNFTGERSTCGACGRRGCRVYDTRTSKQWRHLNFLHCRTMLRAVSHRVSCPSCGVRAAQLPWARQRSSYTLAFEYFVAQLSANDRLPLSAVADLVEEPYGRIRRLAAHYGGHG